MIPYPIPQVAAFLLRPFLTPLPFAAYVFRPSTFYCVSGWAGRWRPTPSTTTPHWPHSLLCWAMM